MKFSAMLDWTPAEYAAKEKEWVHALFTLRLQKASGQLENPLKIRLLRKDLARLKTLQNMPQKAREAAAEHAHAASAATPAAGISEKTEIPEKAKKAAAVARPQPRRKAQPVTKAGKKAAAHATAKGHSPSKKAAAPKGAAAPSKAGGKASTKSGKAGGSKKSR